MLIKLILTVVCIAAVIFLSMSNKKSNNQKIETTQELFNYEDISNDGLVTLPGQKFRRVIEINPINIAIKSQREQASIWETFRTMINSIVFPVTFLIQSTHLDITDYISTVKQSLEQHNNPLLKEYGKIYINHIRELSENKSLRAQRYYMIIRIDVSSNTIDSGVEVDDNTVAMAINAFLRAANRPKKLTQEEAERLARSELDNMISVIGSYLGQMGINYVMLNKKGIVDMAYTTYNRDLSNVVRTKEVDAMEAFSLFTHSLTPSMYTSSGGGEDIGA
ncbi:MAG: hypothetical protein ACOYCB_13315 [Fastidiosipilaceae bacterium]